MLGGEDGLPVIVVIGSSVAQGCGASNFHGWSAQLANALRGRARLVNVAEGGADTGRTIQRFPHVVPQHRPAMVVIGLSLANEGLLWADGNRQGTGERVCAQFEAGVSRYLPARFPQKTLLLLVSDPQLAEPWLVELKRAELKLLERPTSFNRLSSSLSIVSHSSG